MQHQFVCTYLDKPLVNDPKPLIQPTFLKSYNYTPTIGPRVSLGIRGLSLAFHHFFDELNFWRFDLNQTRPKREKFQGVPGRLARYSLMIFVFFRVTVRLSEP